MTKFVLMADSSIRFQLQDEHIEWLRKNGYPEADRFFCEEDRSNPALIQCIEAVRATKQYFVDEASVLYQAFLESKPEAEACNTTREKLHAYCEEHALRMYFDKFTVEDGFKIISYDETRFVAKVVSSWDYNDGSSEQLKLTPYISRDTIDFFVAKVCWSICGVSTPTSLSRSDE